MRPLTQRQTEVLELIARGYSYKQIARTLYITERTIKCHRAKIMDRIGAHNMVNAVALYIGGDKYRREV